MVSVNAECFMELALSFSVFQSFQWQKWPPDILVLRKAATKKYRIRRTSDSVGCFINFNYEVDAVYTAYAHMISVLNRSGAYCNTQLHYTEVISFTPAASKLVGLLGWEMTTFTFMHQILIKYASLYKFWKMSHSNLFYISLAVVAVYFIPLVGIICINTIGYGNLPYASGCGNLHHVTFCGNLLCHWLW